MQFVDEIPDVFEFAIDTGKADIGNLVEGGQVFHDDLAKNVALDDGAVYLNSGTWADLIRFPQDVIEGDKETAIPKLREFVDQLQKGELAEWINFRPTYVRLDVGDDGKVTEAGVHEYRPGETP